jgi:hypothetical protein
VKCITRAEGIDAIDGALLVASPLLRRPDRTYFLADTLLIFGCSGTLVCPLKRVSRDESTVVAIVIGDANHWRSRD